VEWDVFSQSPPSSSVPAGGAGFEEVLVAGFGVVAGVVGAVGVVGDELDDVVVDELWLCDGAEVPSAVAVVCDRSDGSDGSDGVGLAAV